MRQKTTTRQGSVLQNWVERLPLMQQSVLLAGIRGPDGIAKLHKVKPLIRWYRRCILISAFDGKALDNPGTPGGGSFTGPSISFDGDLLSEPFKIEQWTRAMQEHVDAFIDSRDELPLHYFTHMMHAVEIVGYKHPTPSIRTFWNAIYERMVKTLHVWPESVQQLDLRLGDNQDDWRARCDESTSCSD